MSYGGTAVVLALKDGDFRPQPFPGSRQGLQDASDSLLGTKGQMFIGGSIDTDAPVWIHSGTHVKGMGPGGCKVRRTAMANGDASGTGSVFITGPSVGTRYSSGTPGSDISFSNLIVDGNQASFGAVTQSNLIPAGIWADYVDGLRITRVKAINTLGDGFRISQCRNAFLIGVETNTTGQWSVVAARNAINFIGDGAASGAWGYNYNLIGANLVNSGDEAIQASQINLLNIDGVTADTFDFFFECSPAGGTAAGTFGNWTIANVNAINALDYFISFNIGQGGAYVINDVSFANITIKGHATLHDGGVFVLPSTTGFYVNGFSMSHARFRNINTKDTTTHNWWDVRTVDTTGHEGHSISDVEMYGKSGSTRAGAEVGLNFRGAMKGIRVKNVKLKDCPGRGHHLSDNESVSSPVLQDAVFENVTIENANDVGFQVLSGTATGTGTIQDVYYINCIAKNCSLQDADDPAFRILITQSGATIKRIYFRGCRAIKTTGNMSYGLTIARSAGTVDEITIDDCDFQITAATDGMFFDSGVGVVHYTPRPGKGPNIASAATISIPCDGDIFHVTGNTNVTNGITVRAWDNGRKVWLIFDGTPTVSDTGTSKLRAAFVATADDVLPLVCDGTNWYQAAFESVN